MPEDRPSRPVIDGHRRREHIAYMGAVGIVDEWDKDRKVCKRITKVALALLPIATAISIMQAISDWAGWRPLAWVGWLTFVAACVVVVLYVIAFAEGENAYRRAKVRILEYEEYELEAYKLLKQKIAMWDLAYGLEDEFDA